MKIKILYHGRFHHMVSRWGDFHEQVRNFGLGTLDEWFCCIFLYCSFVVVQYGFLHWILFCNWCYLGLDMAHVSSVP